MAKYFWGRCTTRPWLFLLLQRAGYQAHIRKVTSHTFVSDQCSDFIHFLGGNAWRDGGSKANWNDESFCYRAVFGWLCSTGILDRDYV